MFLLKQTWDNGKNNWPHSFLSKPRLLVVMLNLEIHIQAINACLKRINNSVILKFNLENHLLQIIYSTALLDHKPSNVKKMEIWPALPFVHISIAQGVSELALPSEFWEVPAAEQPRFAQLWPPIWRVWCCKSTEEKLVPSAVWKCYTPAQKYLEWRSRQRFVTPEFPLHNSVTKGKGEGKALCVSHTYRQ